MRLLQALRLVIGIPIFLVLFVLVKTYKKKKERIKSCTKAKEMQGHL